MEDFFFACYRHQGENRGKTAVVIALESAFQDGEFRDGILHDPSGPEAKCLKNVCLCHDLTRRAESWYETLHGVDEIKERLSAEPGFVYNVSVLDEWILEENPREDPTYTFPHTIQPAAGTEDETV